MEPLKYHLGLLRFIERNFNETGGLEELKPFFEGKKYNSEKVINEIKSGSELGKKFYNSYLGFLE